MDTTAFLYTSMEVEVDAHNFLLHAHFTPKGDLFSYLNATDNATYKFSGVKMFPLSDEYQVPGIQQPVVNINRDFISFISVFDPGESNQISFVQSSHSVIFYTDWFAIFGDLHVHEENRSDALLDMEHEFFAVTDATIFPVRSVTRSTKFQRKVPLIALNRKRVLGYHPHDRE